MEPNKETNNIPTNTQEISKKPEDINTDAIGKFVSKHFSSAFQKFTNQKLLAPLLIAGSISFVINLLPILGGLNLFLILAPISAILGIFYSFSLINISLKASKMEVPTIEIALAPLSKLIHLLTGLIQIAIESIVKLLQPPFIIPGIKNAIASSFFVPLSLEESASINDSIKKSKESTKGNLLNIFALGFAVAIVNIIGGILPWGIGLVFTSPFGYLVMVEAYRELTNTNK